MTATPAGPRTLDGLDRTDWAALDHVYGSAGEVPGWVRDVYAPERADDAVEQMHVSVYHQGGQICSAAPPLLRYLVAMAADSVVTVRAKLLHLVGGLARVGCWEAERRFVDPGWSAAWAGALPVLLTLLDDPDPGVRRAVAGPLSHAEAEAEAVTGALWARSDVEPDREVRTELAEAAGRLLLRAPGLTSTRDRLRDIAALGRPAERLAAVTALRRALPEQRDPEHLETAAAVLRDVRFDGPGRRAGSRNARGLVPLTAEAFGPDREARTELSLRLLGHPAADHRAGALRAAAEVISTWRSTVPVLLPAVAALLTDTEPENRQFAARVLGMCGEAARPWADGLAALRSGDEVYADARSTAVWALARLGDRRCVGPLADRLSGGRLGFALCQSHADGWWMYGLALLDALSPLAGCADELLGPLRRRLSAATLDDERRALCQVVTAWGAAAAPAVPELLPLLDTDAAVWALDALAAIGPAAAGAVPRARLRALIDAPGEDFAVPRLRRAYWRLTGDPQPALDVLLPKLGARWGREEAVDFLGELGPSAAPYADRIRALLPEREQGWLPLRCGYALWRITGESGEAVPALLGLLSPLRQGGYAYRATITAVHHLAEIGPPAAAAAPVLRAVLAADERPVRHGGWESVPEDDELCGAARAALRAFGT
ncbi:hypothetical protein [Streptomyces sp. LN785]|uniref:hypothetical protein n=1 Tax=Streptomyces sp. LN785 TaxID=3112983 RepID=UPI00370F7F5D